MTSPQTTPSGLAALRRSLPQIAVGATALVAAVLLGAFVLAARDDASPPAAVTAPSGAGAAAAPAGEAASVRVLEGGVHTVYHSLAPLPTEATARADGRPTLVWFSATWCTVCASMDSYANDTFAQFDGRMAFAEKSVDHDAAAVSRLGVRGTPTFVLLDAQGRELERFLYQPDASRLTQAVDQALRANGF